MSNSKDSLGNRMKTYYEGIPSIKLYRRMPVIIRLDSVAAHTLLRNFTKPFDNVFSNSMQATMKYLCENIQGCVFGYTQSDEITLILVDYENLDTSAWFDYKLEKITSVSASMATLAFNKSFNSEISEYMKNSEDLKMKEVYLKALEKGAIFDSRAFNIPKEDVCNCVLWRQRDAEKNSVQMLAQTLYTHREIQGINSKQLQDKIFSEKGINWNDVPTRFKRGSACRRNENGKWEIDNEMPILSSDREYIEKLINL